mgnify:FL=1
MKSSYTKKIFSLFVATLLLSSHCFAFELDTSVDEEIRKNYNPSALEQNLPALPKTAPSQSATTKTTVTTTNKTTPVVPKTQPVSQPSKPQLVIKKMDNDYKFDKSTAIRIKKGTKFRVRSNCVISDYQREGTRVSFTSVKPVTQRYITINEGTRFNAVVEDSHLPQFTGNGGLIVLMVDGIVVNGSTKSVHAKITKANMKKVFLNNIKGKRGYIKGVSRQVDKGENFYKKTRRTSTKLADNPVGLIISPIPTVFGAVVYAVNLVGSPVFAIWAKGSRISIPAGSEFEIKLLEDVYLQ